MLRLKLEPHSTKFAHPGSCTSLCSLNIFPESVFSRYSSFLQQSKNMPKISKNVFWFVLRPLDPHCYNPRHLTAAKSRNSVDLGWTRSELVHNVSCLHPLTAEISSNSLIDSERRSNRVKKRVRNHKENKDIMVSPEWDSVVDGPWRIFCGDMHLANSGPGLQPRTQRPIQM